jgi:hypothetical protein
MFRAQWDHKGVYRILKDNQDVGYTTDDELAELMKDVLRVHECDALTKRERYDNLLRGGLDQFQALWVIETGGPGSDNPNFIEYDKWLQDKEAKYRARELSYIQWVGPMLRDILGISHVEANNILHFR